MSEMIGRHLEVSCENDELEVSEIGQMGSWPLEGLLIDQ